MMKGAKYFALTMLVVVLFGMTRSDLAGIRLLATDTSFFVAQIAEATRLEKEMLQFRVDAAALERGDPAATSDRVKLSFDRLLSRVNTEWTRYRVPRIDVLRNYRGALGELSQRLAAIDATVRGLRQGDRQGLDRIEQAMRASEDAMAAMNREAYAELYQKAGDIAVNQRAALKSLDHMQWGFLIAGFVGFIVLLLQLRRGEQLYAALKVRESNIRSLATLDPLTGLPNRRRFDERMQAIDKGEWRGNLQMLLIDLDGFKAVNDQLGHEAGDRLLKAVAARLPGLAGEGALLARLGGDEFAVVLEGSPEMACSLATAIIDGVSLPVGDLGTPLQVGASIGMASLKAVTNPSSLMLREADAALYEAKARGRGRACHYADLGHGCRKPAAAAEVAGLRAAG